MVQTGLEVDRNDFGAKLRHLPRTSKRYVGSYFVWFATLVVELGVTCNYSKLGIDLSFSDLLMNSSITKRVLQFVALMCGAWCVMTFTHEIGHVICGYACGGKLIDADLAPWSLPYSIFEPDPLPLITLWGGPLFGAIFPVLLASLIRSNWAWFIAYFCLLANGTYLLVAWFSGDRYLDTTKLLEHGAHPISIGLYCTITIGVGYIGFRRNCIKVLGSSKSAVVDD
jgi:hypothetical protein